MLRNGRVGTRRDATLPCLLAYICKNIPRVANTVLKIGISPRRDDAALRIRGAHAQFYAYENVYVRTTTFNEYYEYN